MANIKRGQPPSNFEKYDNFVTSKEGWDVVKKYLPSEEYKIWSPFYHGGEVENYSGFPPDKLIHTNKDFFLWQPEEWDIICDNPPYSIKKQILKRCIDFGKPFALLMPLDTLERGYYRTMVAENPDIRTTVIIPRDRIRFMKDNVIQGSNPCITVWYLFNILEGDNRLIFDS